MNILHRTPRNYVLSLNEVYRFDTMYTSLNKFTFIKSFTKLDQFFFSNRRSLEIFLL